MGGGSWPWSAPNAADFAAYTFAYHGKLPRIASIDHQGRLFRAYGATGVESGGYTSNFTYDSQDRLTEAVSVVHGTSQIGLYDYGFRYYQPATGLEWITMLLNKRRRAIHDFIGGTVVIRTE